MAAVMLFLRQTTGKTERHTHFCIPLEPVFTRDCGNRVHFTDEPTGNLDSKNSHDVIDMLTSASKRFQQTILMITHNNNLTALVDRVFRVSDGVLTDLGGRANETLS